MSFHEPNAASNAAVVASGVLAGYQPEAEIAQQFGESGRTWQRRRRARQGPPYVKIGRRIFYRRAAVEEWLRNRESGWDERQQRPRLRAIRARKRDSA
jgi:predicted DNA-binding transcriptional regulator AlpA